jgi:hypothetical protein
MRKVVLLFIAASLHLATTAHVFGAELEEAISLLKQMHADQCQQQKLRGQLMLAHRNHDQETLNALWPQIEAISKRLKPSEEKLKVLKVSIGNNPADQSAFETALLREADCG